MDEIKKEKTQTTSECFKCKTDIHKNEGHFVFGEHIFCISCWEKTNCLNLKTKPK